MYKLTIDEIKAITSYFFDTQESTWGGNMPLAPTKAQTDIFYELQNFLNNLNT